MQRPRNITKAELQHIVDQLGLYAIMYDDSVFFTDEEPEFVCKSGDWYYEPHSDGTHAKITVFDIPDDAKEALLKPMLLQ